MLSLMQRKYTLYWSCCREMGIPHVSCKQTKVTRIFFKGRKTKKRIREHNIYIYVCVCVWVQLKFHTCMRCCVQDGVAKPIYTERISKKKTDTNTHSHWDRERNRERCNWSTEVSISHIFFANSIRHNGISHSVRQSGSFWLFRWHKVS